MYCCRILHDHHPWCLLGVTLLELFLHRAFGHAQEEIEYLDHIFIYMNRIGKMWMVFSSFCCHKIPFEFALYQ